MKRYTRVILPQLSEMSVDQRNIYEESNRRFGAPTGPTIAFVHAPGLNTAWRAYHSEISKSALPRNLWELSILVVAREWSSKVEWFIHEKWARDAGVADDVIDAIRTGTRPEFGTAAERLVYDFTLEIQREHRVKDETYNMLRDMIGQKQLVELTALIGHYNSVSISLNAHDAQLPPGASVDLPDLDR